MFVDLKHMAIHSRELQRRFAAEAEQQVSYAEVKRAGEPTGEFVVLETEQSRKSRFRSYIAGLIAEVAEDEKLGK